MTERPRAERIGMVVREHRQRAGLTQDHLARSSGLSVRAVRDLENGRVTAPRTGSLERLADSLDLSEGEREFLLGGAVSTRLELLILGPLVVVAEGRPVDAGPPAHQALLALLALRANEFVSRDEIVDTLWGDDPPKTCLGQVQSAVSRLRRVLADGERQALHTARNGYVLRLEPRQLDAARFERLVEQGRYADAIRLWRGPVLADGPPRLRGHPAALSLARRRVAAVLAYADLGHPAVDLLRELTSEEPLQESLHARLIVAHARAGDRVAALQAHAAITARLATELGVAAGEELARAYQVATEADPPATEPPWVRPAQLPAVATGFVGRERTLRQLAASPAPVVVITGTAGVGKTTLAVRWAQQARQSFPDGQLFADLRGYDPAGELVPPASVLRGFLAALGVPAERVPAGFDAQVGLYRSLLADRRLLVVLDNARNAAQVRPLLPGTAGCRTVVTSRDQLRELIAAEGAEPVALDVLDPPEGVRLLAGRIGARRIAEAPDVAQDIAVRCAGLPLALSVVAARAVLYPQFSLRDIAAELRSGADDLDTFDGVRAVFSWSLHTLAPDAVRLFQLCAVHPGPDFAAPAAASLIGWPMPRTRVALAELVRAHLLTERVSGRFAMHDLLRAYARELLPGDEESPATRRILDHYLRPALAAAILLEPHREPIALEPVVAGVTATSLSTAEEALAWFESEHAVLLAAADRAVAAGFDVQAWQLAWTMLDYLDNQGHWRDWITVELAALAAAERRRDEVGQAYAHRILGRGYAQIGRHSDAERHYTASLQRYRRLGDLLGSAHVTMSRAWLEQVRGRPRAALRGNLAALELYRRAAHRVGEARGLNAVGYLYALLGQYQQALDYCQRALPLVEALRDTAGMAATWDSIGFARHHLGQYAEAIRCLANAVELFRTVGDLLGEAEALTHLGDAYAASGAAGDARAGWEAAVAILDRLGHPDADEVRGRLDAETAADCPG